MLKSKGRIAIAANMIHSDDVVATAKQKDKYVFLLDDGSTVYHYKLGLGVFEWKGPFPFKNVALTFEELRAEYFKAVEEEDEKEIDFLSALLAEKQRKVLFKACVRNLKIKGCYRNIFKLAANYARVTVSEELFPESESYEIPGLDTKNGCPVTVYFED